MRCLSVAAVASVCSIACTHVALAADLPVKAPSTLPAGVATAENYLALQVGGMFGLRGRRLTAVENLGYPPDYTDPVNATASDVSFDSSFMVGFKAGRYFDSWPGFGVEFDGQYGRPNFKRQNVTITLKDTTIGGFSDFTEDQLPATVDMFSGALNLLYRFSQFSMVRPYIGAGPAFHVLRFRGSGDSGNIIAPAALATPLEAGPSLDSTGTAFGYDLKAGLEIPLNNRFSIDAEYKYYWARVNVDRFRSLTSIRADIDQHIVAAAVRWKF